METSGSRSEVKDTLPEEGSYRKTDEVIGTLPNGWKQYAYEVDGPLYRGVTLEDYERIKEQGFIDTDMRGAISEHEGMNFATNRDTALEYIPRGEQGVVLAIDPSDQQFWGIDHDDYPRSNEDIPIGSVSDVSMVMDKVAEEQSLEESRIKRSMAMAVAGLEAARERGDTEKEESWLRSIQRRMDEEFPEDQATQDRIWQEASEDRDMVEDYKQHM